MPKSDEFALIRWHDRECDAERDPRFLESGEQDQVFYQRLWRTLTGSRTFRALAALPPQPAA